MTIKELLNPKSIFIDIDVKDHNNALEIITEKLYDSKFIEDKERFLNALNYRENLMSTALNDGIAIPHGISSTVIKPTISLAILKNGIDWDAEDDVKVDLIFTIVLSKEDREIQLDSIQVIADYSLDDKFHAEIMSAKTQKQAYEVLLKYFPL
ncbi:PTS sugar transporter subunit IIA [Mycoplasma anserisalpingitidis]|uniref:PTS sugar transporter subunit IIA n=1 Tax=Mycoplasma anserisalpingitidis TaxID=519450 RepID=UPI001CF6D368|nr:PTS sugar transporter subunit IIA [Mycoplasma anserisalpingitidis]UCU26937.1 PTS sugar transporter subunit IIA [Mycoplasma anserisalpingitidis]UCU27064.1 PTS sugar transporter subunit IIA [Mycoplasma anserisalpingitidis]